MHHLQDLLHQLLRTSSHCHQTFSLPGGHCGLDRMSSGCMRLGCCSRLGRSRIHLVVVEHRSCPAVERNQDQGTGKYARRCAGSRRPSGFRAHPTQRTKVGRLVVAAESAVGVGIESNLAAVEVGIESSRTAAAVDFACHRR